MAPRDPHPHITTERLVELYEAGWTLSQIEDMTGMPYTTVHGRLKRAGVVMRPRGHAPGISQRLPDEELYKTRRLYEAGLSGAEIAQVLGLSTSTVWWRLVRAGVPRRTNGEAQRKRYERRPKWPEKAA